LLYVATVHCGRKIMRYPCALSAELSVISSLTAFDHTRLISISRRVSARIAMAPLQGKLCRGLSIRFVPEAFEAASTYDRKPPVERMYQRKPIVAPIALSQRGSTMFLSHEVGMRLHYRRMRRPLPRPRSSLWL
jgi:hypothetical protein